MPSYPSGHSRRAAVHQFDSARLNVCSKSVGQTARESEIVDGEDDEEQIEDDEELSVALRHRHTIRIHDTHYTVTLTLPPSHQQFSVALHCPRTHVTYANTFNADYIEALTHKAQHPLSFAAFVTLLSSALSTARPSSAAALISSPASSASLDVLSASDIHLLRSRMAGLSSSLASSSLSSADEGKRYLILTTVAAQPARHVHFPLPLPADGDSQHHRQQQPADTTASVQPSASTASPLSALTDTIAQLSRALKEARKEARQERDSRRQREEHDKAERDAMRAEIAWLKDTVKQSGSAGSAGSGSAKTETETVGQLKVRCQLSERQKKETEILLAMWRTRCERAEADLTRLRRSRAEGGRIDSGIAAVNRRRDNSSERVRGRSRERQAHPPSHRLVSSRSVSPSYMQPTSSTAAKRQREQSPLSTSARSSVASSRAASPRAHTSKQPQRARTPPPLSPRPPSAAQPPRPPQRHDTRNSRRSLSPNARTHTVTATSSAAAARASQPPSALSRRSPITRPVSQHSHSPSQQRSQYQPHTHRHSSPTPPPPAPLRSSASQLHPSPRRQVRPPRGTGTDSDGDSETEIDSSGAGKPAHLHSERGEHKESTSPVKRNAAAALSDVFVRPVDVHSRLSALQNFLRKEKAKLRRNVL